MRPDAIDTHDDHLCRFRLMKRGDHLDRFNKSTERARVPERVLFLAPPFIKTTYYFHYTQEQQFSNYQRKSRMLALQQVCIEN
jgi:hypothetical protein